MSNGVGRGEEEEQKGQGGGFEEGRAVGRLRRKKSVGKGGARGL